MLDVIKPFIDEFDYLEKLYDFVYELVGDNYVKQCNFDTLTHFVEFDQ